MFIEKLVNEIYNDEYFKELYDKVCKIFVKSTFKFKFNFLTIKELKDILRFADILSNSKETDTEARNKAYKIISLLKQPYGNEEIFKIYANAILKKLSNFPALNNFDKVDLPLDREIEYELSKIQLEIPVGNGHFTPAQYKIYNMIRNSNFFSFSGPTSMGKSFIIKQFVLDTIVKDKWIKGFCILVPSKALIKQYSLELNQALKEFNIEKFNVLTTPNILDFVEFKDHNFIFVLTPERLLNLLSCKYKVHIDYLIVDEAHKLFEDDDRSLTYYTSVDYCITKFRSIKVIMSSPLIQNPNIYGDMYCKNNILYYTTRETAVSQNLFYIDCLRKKIDFYDVNIHKFNFENVKSLDSINKILLKVGKGSSLVYLNSYRDIIEFSLSLCNYIRENGIVLLTEEQRKELEELGEVISNNIHPEYYLIDCLKYGIAYHFGRLPIFVREKIEVLFKKGTIKYLFCTSTLLEGVNMPAKNLFVFSDKLGRNPISKVDFWNLAGRAGRLGYEFYGNIFCLKIKDKMWLEKDLFLNKDMIEGENLLQARLRKSKRKIKNIITDQNIRKTNADKNDRYFNYVANIIQIDSVSNSFTSMIKNMSQVDENTIQLCKNLINKVDIEVLNASKSIDIKVQNIVLENIFEEKMPKDINMDNCLLFLKKMHELYSWSIKEKRLKNKNSMTYIALIMTKWINGTPLNKIIQDTLYYYQRNGKEVWDRGKSLGVLDVCNKEHINIIVNSLINDIEGILRFDLEKYFNHYYMLLKSKFGQEDIGNNWAMNLEFGTRDMKNIILQNTGFSRFSANFLLMNYKKYLKFDKDILININHDIFNTELIKNSIVYNELKTWIGK